MNGVRLSLITGVAALTLVGCGTGRPARGRGVIDDPRTQHLQCMRAHHLPAINVGQTQIQVGALPNGPTIDFTPTPGAAQQAQMGGQVQSAEVIGSALLYPNGGSDSELGTIEDCLAQGVKG